MKSNGRIEWIDLCKMITMLIVCYDHVIQSISFDYALKNNFFVGSISFHMPLFMLLSGYFINLDKIRQTSLIKFCLSKFKHLMIPAFTWYLIQCILFTEMPALKRAFESYWFLSCLFFCFCILSICSKWIKNNELLLFSVCLITYVMPYAYFVKINFLIPFLCVGYWLRKRIVYLNWKFVLPIFIIYSILYQYWTFEDSVYITPIRFNSIDSVLPTSFTAIFRFIIAITGCLSILYICFFITRWFPQNKLVRFLIDNGKYTLSIYVIHFVFIRYIGKFFKGTLSSDLCISIVLISVFVSIVIVVISLLISSLLRQNIYMKRILLGEF